MMSATTIDQKTAAGIATRILREGYGEGAWHGPDLKAALADVTTELAFWRPAPGRHNIAEIAVHHSYTAHGARAKLSGAVEPFVLKGEDWFDLPDSSTLNWSRIRELVELEHQRLEEAVNAAGSKGAGSPQSDAERFDVVLGITCHAVYHAGQIQLIKRLGATV
jgi:hypothetical protein